MRRNHSTRKSSKFQGLLAFTFLLLQPAHAAKSPEKLLEQTLPDLAISRTDLSVGGFKESMSLPAVEALLFDPLATPTTMQAWSNTLSAIGISSSAATAQLASRWLNAPLRPQRKPPQAPAIPQDVPLSPALRGALKEIISAMAAAKPSLNRAVNSLTPEQRQDALESLTYLLIGEKPASGKQASLVSASQFDLGALLTAGNTIMKSIDRSLPVLKKNAAAMARFPQIRWNSDAGSILISDSGDDVYTAKDLDGVALLVDFGGNNRYQTRVAAADEGEIRIVVDLGREIHLEKAENASAGSGLFGIGLLYLPNPEGTKILRAEDYSIGAGRFGVGAVFVAGKDIVLEGGRFTQGAGSFGLGVLDVRGNAARYRLRYSGQGYGFTRGAGLLLHHGDGALLDGGQSEPDTHEASAAVSFSQGVGYGPRSYASGGVGLALIEGNRCELQASYMAQGMGYWHGLGGLIIKGHDNTAKGRRYVQGTGVHFGVGGFELKGDRNRLLTWGVGPALGWDYAVGMLNVQGNENIFSSDWASGRGDANGRGLAVIQGSHNKITLADFSSGSFTRSAPSFGIAVVVGQDNRYFLASSTATAGPLQLAADPWSLLEGDSGFRLDPELKRQAVTWPKIERDQAVRQAREFLELRMKHAKSKTPEKRLVEWSEVAAKVYGMDPQTPKKAAKLLLSISRKEADFLVPLISSQTGRFGWLLPAFASQAAPALAQEFNISSSAKRTTLLDYFYYMPTAYALPSAEASLSSSDPEARMTAINILSHLLDRQRGQSDGRLRLFETAALLCSTQTVTNNDWIVLSGGQSLSDLFAILSLDPNLSASERGSLASKVSNHYESTNPQAMLEFARILNKRKRIYADAIALEIQQSLKQEDHILSLLRARLQDEDRRVVQAAMTGLAIIGKSDDAPRLSAYLESPFFTLRTAAADGLAIMGAAARKELQRHLNSPSQRTRALAIMATARTTDQSVLSDLSIALRDKNPKMRRIALSGLLIVQGHLLEQRRQFLTELIRLEKEDPSASVRVASGRALASIGR